LYEAQKAECESLREALAQSEERNKDCKEKIAVLEQQIDTMKLSAAFMAPAGSNAVAKEKMDKLIREIDRCISLLEK
jgi:phage shock protein A